MCVDRLLASELDLPWTLPSKSRQAGHHGEGWQVQLDTSLTHGSGSSVLADAALTVLQRSIVVLRSLRTTATVAAAGRFSADVASLGAGHQ